MGLHFISAVHKWLGAALAVALFVVSLSGTLLLWKGEYLSWQLGLTADRVPVTTTAATALLQQTQARVGADNIYLLAFDTYNQPVHKLYLPQRRYAYIAGDGALLDSWQGGERPEELLYDFHHRLLLNTPGLYVVGISGVLALLILLPSGLADWWPRRRSFSLHFWPRRLYSRGALLGSHRNTGIAFLLPIALLLASGIILTFPREAQQLLLPPTPAKPAWQKSTDQSAWPQQRPQQIQQGLDRILAQLPKARLRSIFINANDVLNIALQDEGQWHQLGTHRWQLQLTSGALRKVQDASQFSAGEITFYNSLPLHTGRTGSLLYKMVMTLTGLALCTLCAFGLTSFVLGLRKR